MGSPEPLINEGLELLSEDECRALLRSASVGRVGLSVKALPVILPVNFRLVDDNTVRFWSAPGLKLHAAHTRTVVAFEADGFSDTDHTGWSVLAIGLVAEVEDPATLDVMAQTDLRPWAVGDRHHLIELTIEFLSGRRIVIAPTSAVDRARAPD